MSDKPFKSHPAEVANECEMLAQQAIDERDRESADLHMESCHAIRRGLLTLHRLNERVHSGYDFNADPDRMTYLVSETLKGYEPPTLKGKKL